MINKFLHFIFRQKTHHTSALVDSHSSLSIFSESEMHKYKKNVKNINMSAIVQLIQHEESHIADETTISQEVVKEDKENPREIERNVISIYEDDQEKIEYEDDYQFVLVKKPNINPTIVMPTRIIKELNEET